MPYQKPDNSANGNGSPSWEPRDYVVQTLATYVAKHGRLPAPLPFDLGEAADAWVKLYQKPRRPDEGPQDMPHGRVDTYVSRLVASLAGFLRLTKIEREFVRAGIEDGVDYRGDSFAFYRAVYDEAMDARELGTDQYLADVMPKLKGLGADIARTAIKQHLGR